MSLALSATRLALQRLAGCSRNTATARLTSLNTVAPSASLSGRSKLCSVFPSSSSLQNQSRFKSTAVAAAEESDSEENTNTGKKMPSDLDRAEELKQHEEAATAALFNDDDDSKNDGSAFHGSRLKSGSPSPWAVFDAWGAGADSLLSVPPEEAAKLTPEAVRISYTEHQEQANLLDQNLPGESEILQAYDHVLQSKSSSHFGYPYNLMFDFSELMPFLKYSINNLGDPFVPSNYGVHSRQFEVAVIDFFAGLWKMEKDSYWGYVTTSGTEGNLHGILLAREAFPNGILYTSQETHYSVFKAARYYRMECQSIPTLPMGEIDYDILAAAIRKNSDRPVILNVNIGTTVKGAVDNLDRILRILKQEQIPREQFYIHCDGALFALMMPFIDFAPEVSFRKPIDSIAVSGHKMLGCPMPCGVTLSRKEHVNRLEQHIDYLNSVDTTIMGSRNGQAALYLWYSLRKKGLAGIKRDVVHCMDTARYLRDKLTAAGLICSLNDLSSTVVLEKPMSPAFIQRWQLACEEDIAHVVVMPNVNCYKIDKFVEELVEVTKTHGRVQPKRADSPLTKLGQTW